MKTLLKALMAGQHVSIGATIDRKSFQLYAWSDNSGIVCRVEGSGRLDTQLPSVAGLKRLLAWMDKEAETPQ